MDSGMARKIADGLGQQAAFILALGCLPSHFETILEHALKRVDVVIFNRGVSGEMAEDTAERIRSDAALVGVQYTVRLARDANYVA
jgi:predicted methyltransferase MtxX (methanogen marker protein 4)